MSLLFLLLLAGGVWYFLFGLVVRIALEHDLVRYLGTFLRRSAVACVVWAGAAVGAGVPFLHRGWLGGALIVAGIAAVGHAGLVVALCRRVPRKVGEAGPECPPEPTNEWHAGPVR